MAKFTDAVRATLTGYFNIGDQPTEAQFTALILAIQEGIEEHDHSGTGDGDGVNNLVGPVGIGDPTPDALLDVYSIADGVNSIFDVIGGKFSWLSFQVGGVDKGYLEWNINDAGGAVGTTMILTNTQGNLLLGSSFGIDQLFLKSDGRVGVDIDPAYKFDVLEDRAGSFAGQFFNDGDDVDRHVLSLQGGGEGADVGTTYFIYAGDHAAVGTGWIGTVNGVFQLVDISDEGRKANIVDTKVKGLEVINQLKVRDFNWKANPKGPMMTSFVAQEAREVYPAMVGEFLSGELGTSRAMLIPILTKAIQELDARLTSLGG